MPVGYVRSYEDFKQRIASFFDKFGALSEWFCKPLELSPPECARFGWKWASADMLACCGCGKHLDCGISDSLSHQLRAKHTKELSRALKESHEKHCPWKIAPCPESHALMVPVSEKDALTEFRGRFASLLCVGDRLPALTAPELSEAVSGEGVTEIMELCHASNDLVSWTAAMLAMTGWKAGSGYAPRKCVSCDFCRRNIGTWLYNTLAADTKEQKHVEETEPSSNEAKTGVEGNQSVDSSQKETGSGTKRKHEEEDKFDPLAEHYAWCIWKRQDSSGRPGWKIFVDSLLRNTKSKNTAVQAPQESNVCVQLQKILDKLSAVKELEKSS